HAEVAAHAEREPPGPGLLPGEALRHVLKSSQFRPPDRLTAMSSPDRRLLLVHAHPDDESIYTGATMARYAAEGARVTLVTCTLGELGEFIPPSLAYMAAEKEDRLGAYRIGELTAACAALGVTDHRFLGRAGRRRDSRTGGPPGATR